MKRLLVLPIFLLWPLLYHGQGDSLGLTEEKRELMYAEVLSDSSSQLTPDQLFSSSDFRFRHLDSVLSGKPETLWLRFHVNNTLALDHTWIWEFNTFWARADLYAQSDTGLIHSRSGYLRLQDQKDFPYRAQLYLPLLLKNGQSQTVLIRLESVDQYSFLLENARGSISPKEDVLVYENNIRSILLFFIGAFVALFLFNLFIGLTTRDEIYFFLILLILASLYGLLNDNFFTYPFFTSKKVYLIVGLAGTAILNLANLFFIQRFFDVFRNFTWWKGVFRIFFIAIPLAMVLPLLGLILPGFLMINVLSALIQLSIFIVILLAYRKKLPSAGYLLTAKALGIIPLIMGLLTILSLMPVYEYVFFLEPVTTVLGVILFTFALANKINILRNQNEEKQNMLIETERKHATLIRERAEKLEALDKVKDQFLANTSHELRTPLHGIVGISESLLNSLERMKPESIRDNLRMVISSGKRLTNLVNDLLDYSKLKNRDIKVFARPQDLHAMVGVVLRLDSHLLGKKKIELKNQVPRDFPYIEADENRLQQVLHNLIGNAIKFTDEGSISVSAESREGMAIISVQDTGAGIPLERQQAIFQDFEQADGSSQRSHGGTGLGLSISKKLIELQGGQIGVESTEGKGSRFYFSLPLATGEPSVREEEGELLPSLMEMEKGVEEMLDFSPAIQTPSPITGGDDKDVQVLIVDDEPINQQVLVNHLMDLPYTLHLCSTGGEALDLLSKHHIDVVLLDVMMPRMSGFEVCQKIRKHYLPSELPVIMITAKNQVRDLVEGLYYGANDYLAKPFSKDELLARLKTHLNLYSIHSATSKFVPSQFIKELGKESITDIRLGDFEEKEVTVVFADIRDYTQRAEMLGPEAVFRFVTDHTMRMGPIIEANQGFINQFYGDGIMSLFLERPDDALIASIEMQRILHVHNEDSKLEGASRVMMGVGMDTGSLIMGIIGHDTRMDATTLSDTVNTSSRMEGLTKYFGVSIIVSENTFKGLEAPEQFHYRYLGKVKVKGRTQAQDVYDFFDGDPEPIRSLKMKTFERFNEGVRAYLNKAFKAAQELFLEVLEVHPDDKSTQIYLQNCKSLIEGSLGEDWTGIEIIQNK